MRVYDFAGCYRVIASRVDVAKFNASWPCSPIKPRAIMFEFSRGNGDLVDTNIRESEDGDAALALAEDCQRYGVARLKLDVNVHLSRYGEGK